MTAPVIAEPPPRGGDVVAVPGDARAVVRRLASGLRAGRSSAVAVTGPRGPVRDSLTRRATALATLAGATVLTGRGTPAEQDWPYGVVEQLAARLPGPRLVAPLRQEADAEPPRSVRVQEFAELFLRAARHRPLVLVVDDAQWADAASLDVLTAVLRRMRGTGLSVVVTVDGGAPDAAPRCTGLLTLLSSPTVHGHVVRLGPAADPSAVDRDGKWRTPAEPTWGLGPGPLALLRGLAVCRDLFPLHLVYALAGLDGAPAASHLRGLRAAGLVTGDARPRLTDVVSAERVLSAMPDAERRELFERAAELGHRAALGDDRLAGLLLPARPSGAAWAVDVLRRTAAAHRARGEHRQAARCLTRVLREPLSTEERVAVLVELGAAACLTDPEAGDRFLVQALHLTGDRPDPRQRALAADLLLARGDAGAARQALASACRAADADGRERRMLRALLWFAEQAQVDAGGLDGLLPDTEPLPEDPDDPSGLAAVVWRTAVSGRDAARVRELGRAVLASPDRDLPLYPRVFTCLALATTGLTEEALAGLDGCLAEARRRRVPPLVGLVLLARCEMHLRRGDTGRAGRDLEMADKAMPPGRWYPAMESLCRSLRARLALAAGDLDEAARVVAADCPPGFRQQVAWPQLLFARAVVHLAAGRPDEAGADLRECGRWLLARGWANPLLVPWRCVGVVAHARAGRTAEAARFSAELRDVADAWGTPAVRGLADLASGTLARGPTAVRLLKRAAALLREPALRALAVRQLALAREGPAAPDP
ncbi:ATP-binding protein [Streptomyces sp. NPDC046939]|uniref:ATP-binding protein n=1 Tax=Streptomyces sp. NPDC046939 TaxID=3155376 RepID=UPI00340AD575